MQIVSRENFSKTITVAVLLFAIAAISVVQFWTPTLYGADGYLHIRMAKFIKDYGAHYSFHWARYSTFTKNFADKDFLYHLALIPFVNFFSKNIFLGAKVSSIFFAIIFLLSFLFILRRYSAGFLAPLFLLAILLSDRFFYLFLWPRPMIFVIALTFLGMYSLIEEKYLPLFLVTVIYCLSHVSGPYMLLYAILTEGVRFINCRKFNFKNLLWVGLAIVIAYAAHPNFPNNILVFYLNAIIVPIFSVKWGIELGAEFFPISTREFLLSYPFFVIAIVLIFFIAVFLRPKAALKTQVLGVCSCVYFIFSFLSQRYIAHGYPLMLLTLASYLQDYQREKEAEGGSAPLGFLSWIAMAIFCLVAIVVGISTYKSLRDYAFRNKIFDSHYETVGKFLEQNVPKGELVFHTNWSDSQYLIGVNPNNDYIVTFDPTYMFYYDKKLYNLYRDVSFGRSPDPYGVLKDTLKANYGYAGKNYFGALVEQIRRDPRFSILGEDNLGVVFKLN